MEYTTGGTSWRQAVRRAAAVFRLRHRPSRPRSLWSVVVPVIMLTAGVLFTMSATTAKGTTLREERTPELAQLLEERQADVDRSTARAEGLRADIDNLTNGLAAGNTPIAAEVERRQTYEQAAGLTTLHGPGLTVRLNDAPRLPDGSFPDVASVDQLVVHQQDVQSVVNALWAGGGEAMTIMGVRILSTTAVQCVGNTLLLDGRRYSPEFVISVIGNPEQLRRSLDASPGVQAFQSAARDLGLGYRVTTEADIVTPAYQGSVELRDATVPVE
jgi:uncharacterized protein YlxW (UPF0749 family)